MITDIQQSVFHFEVEGRRVLGFDTGLSSAAFAKARLNTMLTERGLVADFTNPANISLSFWHCEGVIEYKGRMVFYGPGFSDSLISLDAILSEPTTYPAAMGIDAIRRFLQVLVNLERQGEHDRKKLYDELSLFPAGVFQVQKDMLFVAPAQLVKRSILYQNSESYLEKVEAYLHPDKSGSDQTTFAAAVLLYR
ncbi:MAG: hypothetical protein SNJ56_05155 [Termitinemataceae bacterium]